MYIETIEENLFNWILLVLKRERISAYTKLILNYILVRSVMTYACLVCRCI